MSSIEKKFLIIILLFVFVLILLPFFALDYFTSERKTTDMGTFTNSPGNGGIDNLNHFYWNNKKNVFIKYINKCYIAEYDEEQSKSMYKDKNYNVREEYVPVFKISENKCKSINSILMSDNFLYTLNDNGINIYNLKTKKKKEYRLKNYKVYGINNNEIYFEIKDKKYKSNRNITKKEKINEIPKNFESVPQKFDFSKDEV